ncbi:MAG TPA: transposase domain-containing protein, partial [Azospirillaceae bacterium]|nr:transposase domain-containing protein [Azospirillaceae bacterium]
MLEETDRQSQRHRLLTARVVVYFVMALGLYVHAFYGEVLRGLLEGVRGLGGTAPPALPVASKSALTQARLRLGVQPLRRLLQQVAGPVATPQTPGAWYRSRRLVSLDGTTVDVADTPANQRAFDRPGTARG